MWGPVCELRSYDTLGVPSKQGEREREREIDRDHWRWDSSGKILEDPAGCPDTIQKGPLLSVSSRHALERARKYVKMKHARYSQRTWGLTRMGLDTLYIWVSSSIYQYSMQFFMTCAMMRIINCELVCSFRIYRNLSNRYNFDDTFFFVSEMSCCSRATGSCRNVCSQVGLGPK